jgi:DNA gyrase inhibitor GyrI
MNLTESPERVTWPTTHYLYVERVGPFMETAPAAWETLHRILGERGDRSDITGYLSLYRIDPEPVYRAGVSLKHEPREVPDGLAYVRFDGGPYLKFVLTGPYSDLPQAGGRVFEILEEQGMPIRDDFFLEHYVNDPETTPEADLVTEILIPSP